MFEKAFCRFSLRRHIQQDCISKAAGSRVIVGASVIHKTPNMRLGLAKAVRKKIGCSGMRVNHVYKRFLQEKERRSGSKGESSDEGLWY